MYKKSKLIVTILATLIFNPLVADASVFKNCASTNYSPEEVSQAITDSPNSPESLKSKSCVLGGISNGESGGNKCEYNGGNTGVLQLNNAAIRAAGYTPEEYANLSLQEQVDIWASSVGSSNISGGFTTIATTIDNGGDFGGTTPTTGMLAACFQFGPAICKNDINYMKNNGGACPTASSGGINYNDASPKSSANLDGNNQSICSWGKTNQASIDKACKNASCNSNTAPSINDFGPISPTGTDSVQHISGFA